MSEGEEASDQALFLAYKDGDEAAFDTLFQRHRGPLTGYAWRMVRRKELAEELALEAFCRVLEGAYTPGGSLRSFLFTIVHRLCIDRGRKLARRQRLKPLLKETEPVDTPEAELAHDEEIRRLEAAIGGLPEAHRAVLLLYYQEELPSKEVARILGLKDHQVRSKLSYARTLLRKALEDDDG